MHPRPCVKLVGHRTDDPQSKFPSEHSKLERTWVRSGIVSAGNSAGGMRPDIWNSELEMR
jgi:hypothetical protein